MKNIRKKLFSLKSILEGIFYSVFTFSSFLFILSNQNITKESDFFSSLIIGLFAISFLIIITFELFVLKMFKIAYVTHPDKLSFWIFAVLLMIDPVINISILVLITVLAFQVVFKLALFSFIKKNNIIPWSLYIKNKLKIRKFFTKISITIKNLDSMSGFIPYHNIYYNNKELIINGQLIDMETAIFFQKEMRKKIFDFTPDELLMIEMYKI
jgi:hypothetical protein